MIRIWHVAGLIMGILVVAGEARAQMQVVSSAEPGGAGPATLADIIIDNSVDIVRVGSVTTNINGGGNPPSSLRAMGVFIGGLTPGGTPLPAENQPPTGPQVTYAGGIGLYGGVILCTGLASDNDPDVQSIPEGLGVGAQGPNNGHPLGVGVIGEVDFQHGLPDDADFVSEVAAGGDATVLNFDIELDKPGILRFVYVHASDEFPRFPLKTFDDSLLVFVRNPRCPNAQFENFIVFRELNGEVVEENTLSLNALDECGKLDGNFVAPVPTDLLSSPHAAVGTTDRFDHEYGGFTVPLMFEMFSLVETSPLYNKALAPGGTM